MRALEGDSEQIIKQYEERLLRYQKSLEESDQVVSKHQKAAHSAHKNYEDLSRKIEAVHALTSRVFAGKPSKESGEAVEELCEIDKCKEYMEEVERAGLESEGLSKIVATLLKHTLWCLNRKREGRILFMKKEAAVLKALEEEKAKTKAAEE